MLSAFSVPGSDRITSAASLDISPIDLACGFPRGDDSVCVSRKIHAAHGTGVDVPLVEQSSLKSPAVVTGGEKVNIAVHGFCCRAIERKHVTAPVDESLHPTTTACPRLLRPCFRL